MDTINRNQQKISNIYLLIFLIYLFLIIFTKFTSYAPQFHIIYIVTVIMYTCTSLVFLLFMKYNDGSKSKYDLIFFIIFTLLILARLIFKLQVLTFPLIAMLITIVNLKYVNVLRFIKDSFYVELMTDTFIVVLSLCHIFPIIVTYRHGLPRINFGFATCNDFATAILCLIFSYLLLIELNKYKYISFRSILLISMIYVITFLLTESRDFGECGLILIVYLLCDRLNLIKSFLTWISPIIVIVSCIVSILIPIITVPDTFFFYNFNTLLSNRLSLQMMALEFYPVRLLGRISMPLLNVHIGLRTLYIDNSYLSILLYCGIIGLVIFEFIFIKSLTMSIKSNKYILCGILVSLSLYLMVEAEYFDPDIFIPIIFSYVYYHKYIEKRSKDKI